MSHHDERHDRDQAEGHAPQRPGDAREEEQRNRQVQDEVSGNRLPGGGSRRPQQDESGPIDENL